MSSDKEREIVDLIGKRFISHGEQYAEQWKNADGEGYAPRSGPLKRADLVAHLRGERSLGHYLISPIDDHVKLVAFDLDVRKECRAAIADPEHPDHDELKTDLGQVAMMLADQTRRVAAEISVAVTCAVAFSGNKGVHVYGWFAERAKASNARKLARMVLDSFEREGMPFLPLRGDNFFRNETDFPRIDIEIFPKQSGLEGKTHGNLMRLPLGRHLKSGKEAYFIRNAGFMRVDPMRALEAGCLG